MTEETSVIRIYVEPSVYAKMATIRAYHDRPLSVLQAAMDAFLVEIHPQPSQELWNGEGLPPVGAVCEYRTGLGMNWSVATVLAFGEKKVFYRDSQGFEWTRPFDEIEFRHIRTPEQIAAEERDREVDEIIAVIGDAGDNPSWPDIAAELHAAGYRKITK